jgi:hypothetical protein
VTSTIVHGGYPGIFIPGLDYPSEPVQIGVEGELTEGESVFKDSGWSLYHDVPFDWAGH